MDSIERDDAGGNLNQSDTDINLGFVISSVKMKMTIVLTITLYTQQSTSVNYLSTLQSTT